MDMRKFDNLTRSLATGKSRRSVIKGLFGGAVSGVAVVGRPAYGVFAQAVPCSDMEPCAEGYICCAGVCSGLQCCIDNPDPNATCPEGTSCFEGYCDPITLGCGSDADCATDEICCNGVCAAIECCIDEADPNARCPQGTTCFEGYCDTPCEIKGCVDGQCCCADGSCSAVCCETPVLPATGSGPLSTPDHGSWIAAAAVGGTAAYLAARKTRSAETDSAE